MPATMKLVGTSDVIAKQRRSPEERWTKRLIKKGGGFTPVSDYFLKNYCRLVPELTTAEVVLIVHLISYKWDAEMPYPGSKALAKRMGISGTAVRNHLRSLERSKKCLHRVKRVGTTNAYDLTPLFGKLEGLLDTDTVEAAK